MLKRRFNITLVLLAINIISYGQSSFRGTVCAESTERYGVKGYDDSEFIWTLEGGVIVDGNGEHEVEVQWGYKTGRYIMEVVEITESDCIGAPSQGNITVQAPEVNLGYDFYELCDNDSVIFDADGAYEEPYTFQWYDGTTSSTFQSDTGNYAVEQNNIIWVKVTDGRGCERYDTLDLFVHELPSIDLGNDTVLCDMEDPLIIDIGDFAFYDWTTNTEEFSTNPATFYPKQLEFDTIKITVTDQHMCQMSDTMLLYPCSVTELFKGMPNTFTPNGDGENEIWEVRYSYLFQEAVLEVFDRWGRLVHRDEDGAPNLQWDGTSNGRDMPMDSYFYVLDLRFYSFEPITGTVNLVK